MDARGTLHIYQVWSPPDTAGMDYDREIATFPAGGWNAVLLNTCANPACSCQGSAPLEHDAFADAEPGTDGPPPVVEDRLCTAADCTCHSVPEVARA